MDWLVGRQRRGPPRGWTEHLLADLALPPPHLLLLLFIVILFLSLSWYADYRTQIHRADVTFRLLLFLLPALLLFALVDGRFALRLPWPRHPQAGSSAWGVAALVALLLLMVWYQSTFHSHWFRPLWRRLD